jgi:hypothetical protein
MIDDFISTCCHLYVVRQKRSVQMNFWIQKLAKMRQNYTVSTGEKPSETGPVAKSNRTGPINRQIGADPVPVCRSGSSSAFSQHFQPFRRLPIKISNRAKPTRVDQVLFMPH